MIWTVHFQWVAEKRGAMGCCPACRDSIPVSTAIFREGFRCPRCGVVLHVSPTYGRTLVLLSALIGFVLVWLIGARDLVRLSLFGLPTAFLVMTVLVRVVPHLVPPSLLLRGPEHSTTLGLTDNSDEDSGHDRRG